jgi:hypothetical protein
MNGEAVSGNQGVRDPASHAYIKVVAHRSGGVRRSLTVTTSDPA